MSESWHRIFRQKHSYSDSLPNNLRLESYASPKATDLVKYQVLFKVFEGYWPIIVIWIFNIHVYNLLKSYSYTTAALNCKDCQAGKDFKQEHKTECMSSKPSDRQKSEACKFTYICRPIKLQTQEKSSLNLWSSIKNTVQYLYTTKIASSPISQTF